MVVQISVESLLAKNKVFQNTHVGERCFILGNGPSLRDVDLSLLADEFVFTVNNFSFVDGFEKAKTNVHLWTDPSFFEAHTAVKFDMDRVMSNYHKMATQNPICFVTTEAFDFIKKNKLDEILDVYYLQHGRTHIFENAPVYLNISEQITGYYTVVQYAIVIAIYMGFKEIYMLGCDASGILDIVNALLDNSHVDDHAYHDPNMVNISLQAAKNMGITNMFHANFCIFLGYDKLSLICWKQLGIKLINCSSKTIITSIPRMKLSDVLGSK